MSASSAASPSAAPKTAAERPTDRPEAERGTPPKPVNERQATRERVLQTARWLIAGALRVEAVNHAMDTWKVSRRTAQKYVQKAAHRIAMMTDYDDPLFYMKLSQVQRDRMFQQLQEALRQPLESEQALNVIRLMHMTLRVLDSRDRTADRIAKLEKRRRSKLFRKRLSELDRISRELTREAKRLATSPPKDLQPYLRRPEPAAAPQRAPTPQRQSAAKPARPSSPKPMPSQGVAAKPAAPPQPPQKGASGALETPKVANTAPPGAT